MEDTKLPHGPINEFFLRCLSERCDLTDEVGVGDYHPAAAVSFESQIVEDSFRVLAHTYTL